MDDLPLYVDIDGTLTDSKKRGGNPIHSRIEYIKYLISEGRPVVLWSATGTKYAKAFAEAHGIKAIACIGKPRACIDDCGTIRPIGKIVMHHPKDFFAR